MLVCVLWFHVGAALTPGFVPSVSCRRVLSATATGRFLRVPTSYTTPQRERSGDGPGNHLANRVTVGTSLRTGSAVSPRRVADSLIRCRTINSVPPTPSVASRGACPDPAFRSPRPGPPGSHSGGLFRRPVRAASDVASGALPMREIQPQLCADLAVAPYWRFHSARVEHGSSGQLGSAHPVLSDVRQTYFGPVSPETGSHGRNRGSYGRHLAVSQKVFIHAKGHVRTSREATTQL